MKIKTASSLHQKGHLSGLTIQNLHENKTFRDKRDNFKWKQEGNGPMHFSSKKGPRDPTIMTRWIYIDVGQHAKSQYKNLSKPFENSSGQHHKMKKDLYSQEQGSFAQHQRWLKRLATRKKF